MPAPCKTDPIDPTAFCGALQSVTTAASYCFDLAAQTAALCEENPTALPTTAPCSYCAKAGATSKGESSSASSASITTSSSQGTDPPTSAISSPPVVSSTISGSPSNTTVAESQKFTDGAVAGIGIGGVLIGALLAGLVVFFIMRKKKYQSFYPQQHLPDSGTGYVEQEKREIGTSNMHVKGGLVTNVDRLLPQPVEDDAIIKGLSKIRDGVKNHAQNYYHNAPVNQNMVDEAKLVGLASATGIPTAVLRDLFLNPATRMPVTKLFLGHLILSRCGGQSAGKQSFLPDDVSVLAASSSSASGSDGFQPALFSKWKVISGALLQRRYGQQPAENDPRYSSIIQVLEAAEPVLHPFIDPNADTNARRRNLEGIAKRAAQFAFLLFSQPGSFQFDYSSTGEHDSLIVFPALLQTVNDVAEPVLPPRVLSEKEVVSGLQ